MIRAAAAALAALSLCSTAAPSAPGSAAGQLAAAQRDYEQGAYASARAFAAKVQEVRGATAAERARALTLAGRAATLQADYPAALASLKRAESAARGAGLRKLSALALIYQGDVYERMKQHPRALDLYRRGLARLKVPEDAHEARVALLQIGDIHVAAARFDDAQAAYEKALEYARASGDPEATAQSLDYNGFFHRKLGNADRAIASHELALEYANTISGAAERSRALARAWNHLGLSQQLAASLAPVRETALEWLGQGVQSELRALQAAREAGDRLRQGYVLRALAALHRDRAELAPQGADADMESSMSFAAQALELAVDMKHPEWEGLALHALAVAQARTGRVEESAAAFARAVALWERIGDVNAMGGGLRLRASELHERRGDTAAAKADYARALEAFERIRAGDEIAAVLVLQGRLAERDGDVAGAKQAYLRAVDAIESLRGRVSSEENRLAFLARRLEPYEALIRLLLRDPGRASAEDRALAFRVSERTRGRALLDLMARASQKLHAGVDAATLAKERALELRIAGLSRSLAQARTNADTARLRTALDEVRQEHGAFQDALGRRYPRYGQLKNPQPVDLTELSARVLQPGELLLEYFVGREDTYLFAVSKQGVRLAQPLGIGAERLGTLVRKLREGVELGPSGDPARLLRFDLVVAHELYRLLLAPAADEIAAARRLAVVPHGALFYLPLELLVAELPPAAREPGFGRYAAAEYFIERAPPLRYALSASLLDPALTSRAARAGSRPGRVLAFVNPVAREAGRSARGESLMPASLPFAEAEGERIRKVFGRSADVYSREAATRERFLQQGGRYGRLLVSAHGIFDEDEPMQSGVVMVNAQGAYALVTAEDLFNMRLGVRLASFAACDIGLGRIRAGEGLLGLTRAAKYAGAENLVVSLWSVDDRSTSGLMARFYEGVLDGDEASALRSAKLELLRAPPAAGGLPYAPPFFWAAFVLY